MLDVVFIMLIFFIVTASFISERGFDVNRPPDHSSPKTDRTNAVFVISETDEIWLDGRLIDPRSVRANIERIIAVHPDASVIVRAHELASAMTYVGILDQAREVSSNRSLDTALVTYRN